MDCGPKKRSMKVAGTFQENLKFSWPTLYFSTEGEKGHVARIMQCSVLPLHLPADKYHDYHHLGSKKPQQGG